MPRKNPEAAAEKVASGIGSQSVKSEVVTYTNGDDSEVMKFSYDGKASITFATADGTFSLNPAQLRDLRTHISKSLNYGKEKTA